MRRLIDTPSTFAPQEVWQDFLAEMQRLHETDPDDQQVVEAIADANAFLDALGDRDLDAEPAKRD